ncbi:hypothetical protein [Telluria beijingensis]|uniref:hypothetical protein n=1 Tax=Telluria beijingensis TaxID=3068633 RepID=UPI002795E8D7|nr:hypothetical protein [Massilia sp. REN29]
MITALTDPSQLPNQLQDQQTFDTNMASMIDNLPLRAQQENALAANMSAYAAGGAYSFMYGFDTATTAGDPGPGKLRFNAAGQSSAGAIYIDPVTVGGGNIDNLLVSIGANLSLLKGSIRLVKAADPTRWMLFDISDVVAGSGYRALAVAFRASSSATPFGNGDALQVFLDRTGDRAVDLSPIVRIGGGAVSNGTLNIDYLNLFSDDYYRYQIELTALRLSDNNGLAMRLAIGGTVNAGASSYAPLGPDGGGTVSRSSQFTVADNASGSGVNMTINVRGARNSTRTNVGANGTNGFGNNYAEIAEGYFDNTSAISGFRLFGAGSGATFISGQIDIYGYRKV